MSALTPHATSPPAPKHQSATGITAEQLRGWLKLAHTSGLGPVNANRLLLEISDVAELASIPASRLRHWGMGADLIGQITDNSRWHACTDQVLDWLQSPDHHLLHRDHPDYPALLNLLPDAPVLLYLNGNPDALSATSLAIVGSRKATRPALQTAGDISFELAGAGLNVVSGLARGIDQAAHHGALQAQGRTVAVVGTGLDSVYPREHAELSRQISNAGALVSEFALGTPPRGINFPRRNRIISGLSMAVVVIEAARRSGTLSTARHALEQGRDVMAMPGSIKNPYTRGCHDLIRAGAILVESAADIIAEVAPQFDTDGRFTAGSTPVDATGYPADDETGARLLEIMGFEPTPLDLLVARSGLPVAEVAAALVRLEIHRRVISMTGSRYARC